MVDEDPFLLVASINIATIDLRAILNEIEDEKLSLNVKIRKIWVLKQYLVYKGEFTIQGKVSIVREKEKKLKVSISFKTENQEGETLQRK